MTLDQIAHLVLENIRNGHIVDDERLDIRLLYDWIDMKRSDFIKKTRNNNPNSRFNLNWYQHIELGVFVDNVYDAGDYPYSDSSTQLYKIVESEEIPAIVEDKEGPIIYSIESDDLMKLPFSIVSFDHLRFAGNGKFNKNLIFTAVRDNKVYFKYNTFFDDQYISHIRAIFDNPREVPDFSETTSEYPIDNAGIEYIKNAIMEADIRNFLALKADEISDSSGEIKE